MKTMSRTQRHKTAFHIHPWSVATGDQHVLAFHCGVFSDAIVDERVSCLRCSDHVDHVGWFEGHTLPGDVTQRMKKTNKPRHATVHKLSSCFS